MPQPPLVVTNAVQVRLLGTVASNGAVQVLHARKTSGLTITQALANTVGTAIKAAWTSRFGTLAAGQTSLVRVGLRDLSSAGLPEFLDTGAAVLGAAAGEVLPAQLALCVTMRTQFSGKSFRGRTYFGGFTEADNTGAAASTAVVTACTGFLTDVSSALTTNGLTMAILSRPAYSYTITKSTTLPTGSTETEVIGRGSARSGGIEPVTIIQSRNNSWETQRRRNNGRGGVPAIFIEGAQIELQPG